MKISNNNDSHRYLRCLVSIPASNCQNIEFQNRQRVSFHNYKSTLLDHHKSLYLRLKYFSRLRWSCTLVDYCGITYIEASVAKDEYIMKEDAATNRRMTSN